MSKKLILYVDIGCFVHATEDQQKVVEAMKKVLPEDHVDKIHFTEKKVQGHYGNPITLFGTRIHNQETIQAFIDNLSLRLDNIDKATLLQEISLHIADGSLYFRLDKQAAFQGKLQLYSVDHIRIKIRFTIKKTEEVIQTCRELGIIL